MLNLSLRLNRENTILSNRHGDIWLQVMEAAAQQPDLVAGSAPEMEVKISQALQLTGQPNRFPLPRLLTIWRNAAWCEFTHAWC
jgi:hypothetical protein